MPVPGDLRRALRSLAGRRAFAATVVLTLALAFSIPAVVLSTVDRHFWRPLDLADSERLFTLQLRFDDGRFSPLSHPEYLQLRAAGAEAFSLATFGPLDFTLVAGGAPTRVNVALVSGNFFTVLGAAPAHGRLLAPPDDDPGAAAAVAVVSHRAWTSQFGRNPELVGRTVRLGLQAFTVVGIAANPLPGPAHEPDFWVPVSALSQLLPDSAGILLGPAARWLHTVGRLLPSTSRGDAAVLASLAKARLPADVAAARTEDWRFVARPLNHARLGPEYHREATRFLTLLVLITGVFLLAACSNLVLLLLTRGAEQAHELAVRRALGASRLALVRPFAAEMLVLVGAGALAASMALRWVGPVVSTLPQLAPLGPAVSLDTGVVLWMLAVAGAAWAIVCLGVLLMTAARPPAPDPRVTGRGGRQAALVAVQVAVSGVLVVAAGLLLRSAHGVASTPPGFVPRDILVAQLHTAGYAAAEGHVLYRRLLDELRTGGLVTSAALGWHTPLSVFQLSVAVETPGASMEVSGNVVSGDYFRTLGIAVLEGREFTSEDHAESAPVAVVNRTLAERLWPGRPAVGRVLAFPRSGGERTVIGVVDDVRYGALAEPARPLAYLPLAQRFFPRVFIHARAPANPGVTLQHVRRALADLDPAVPLSGVSTLSERVDEALDRWRAPALLAGLLALVTLVLTMAGLYGVLTLAVGQRTRELAIRVALGARETSVRRMVLGQGMRLVAAGARVGLAAAVPLMRLLASQLYGVAPHDVATLGVSLVVLLAAGGLACDLPARGAGGLDTPPARRSE
ncbi:MAG: FtsX-like permease family protein [Acidobacteria bacterium]|nr:FtsX-like permease family protein [Acidobacteriota bacterium]